MSALKLINAAAILAHTAAMEGGRKPRSASVSRWRVDGRVQKQGCLGTKPTRAPPSPRSLRSLSASPTHTPPSPRSPRSLSASSTHNVLASPDADGPTPTKKSWLCGDYNAREKQKFVQTIIAVDPSLPEDSSESLGFIGGKDITISYLDGESHNETLCQAQQRKHTEVGSRSESTKYLLVERQNDTQLEKCACTEGKPLLNAVSFWKFLFLQSVEYIYQRKMYVWLELPLEERKKSSSSLSHRMSKFAKDTAVYLCSLVFLSVAFYGLSKIPFPLFHVDSAVDMPKEEIAYNEYSLERPDVVQAQNKDIKNDTDTAITSLNSDWKSKLSVWEKKKEPDTIMSDAMFSNMKKFVLVVAGFTALSLTFADKLVDCHKAGIEKVLDPTPSGEVPVRFGFVIIFLMGMVGKVYRFLLAVDANSTVSGYLGFFMVQEFGLILVSIGWCFLLGLCGFDFKPTGPKSTTLLIVLSLFELIAKCVITTVLVKSGTGPQMLQSVIGSLERNFYTAHMTGWANFAHGAFDNMSKFLLVIFLLASHLLLDLYQQCATMMGPDFAAFGKSISCSESQCKGGVITGQNTAGRCYGSFVSFDFALYDAVFIPCLTNFAQAGNSKVEEIAGAQAALGFLECLRSGRQW